MTSSSEQLPLSDALSTGTYLSYTLTAPASASLDLRNASMDFTIWREEYHAPRYASCHLMTLCGLLLFFTYLCGLPSHLQIVRQSRLILFSLFMVLKELRSVHLDRGIQ